MTCDVIKYLEGRIADKEKRIAELEKEVALLKRMQAVKKQVKPSVWTWPDVPGRWGWEIRCRD